MKFTALFAAVALATVGSTHATLNGFSSTTLGDRSSANVEFATWDVFSSAVLSAVAAQSGDLASTLSQSVSSTPPYGPQTGAVANDLFYTFTKATNFTLAATSTLEIENAVLQLKFTTPASAITVSEFFAVTLNGLSVTPSITATGIEPGGLAGTGYNIVRWSWTNLNLDSGAPLTLNFSSAAGGNHVAIDAISLDVAPVPEPSTYGIAMAAMLGALVYFRRRRALRAGA